MSPRSALEVSHSHSLRRKDVVRVRGYLKRLDYPTAATRSTVVPTAVFVSTFAWIEVKAEGPRPLGGAELFLSSIRATRALSAHLKVSLEVGKSSPRSAKY